MTPSTFDALRRVAEHGAGLMLRPGKEALVSARLAKRIRALGLRDENDYLAFLTGARGGTEMTPFLDALATNVTAFFREPEHFVVMTDHLAERVRGGAMRLRVWSAACSTGEEPLSIAMTMEELLAGAAVDWRVLGTDLSETALAKARSARYSPEEIAPIPPGLRERHLRRDGDHLRPADHITSRLSLEYLNLARAPYPLSGPLDVVFCRNAMIYFSREVKQQVVSEVERLLRPGGLFFIGHSETLHGLDTGLRPIRPSIYVKD